MFKPLFIILLLILSLSGCNDDKQIEENINIALSSDIKGFDPVLSTDVRTGKIISLVYDNLVSFGDSTEIVPGIAKRWSLGNDRKTYTFFLRKNAFFHDGTPITSKGVLFSLERLANPKNLSPQVWLLENIEGLDNYILGKNNNISGIKIINDTLIQIKLKKPFSPFIQFLAMPATAIVNARNVNNISSFPAGSGPWKYLKWERGGKIVLFRNENYWGLKPKEKKLVFRILSENLARSAEFKAGNLDYLEIPSTDIQRWKNDKSDYKITRSEDLNIWYIGLNCSSPPFNNPKIRKAVNFSLDRKKYLFYLMPGASLASGPIPKPLLKEQKQSPYEYNPEKALALMTEAGYPDGFSTELWVGNNSEMSHVLEAFQADWSAVGIKVKLIKNDWNIFKSAIINGKPPMYYLNWTADYPDAENFLYPLFYSKESMSKRNRYSNKKLDDLIIKIQSISHGIKRDSLISIANDILIVDAPWIFLWHKEKYSIVQKNIKGYTPKLIFNAEKFLNWDKKSG